MGSRRVLIADGDVDSRAVYRILLQHHGYEVLEVADGEAALSAVQVTDVDIVITELTLRLIDGHTLLERLRADERTRSLCVIVLTARGLDEDRHRAEKACCERFLTKPIEPKELLKVIREVT